MSNIKVSCKICGETGDLFINTWDDTPNPLFLRTEDDDGYICTGCFSKKEELKELMWYSKIKGN